MKTGSLIRSIVLAIFLFSGNSELVLGQEVSYTMIEDDPYAVKRLYVRLNPFYVEGFQTNKASIGTGLELKYASNNFNVQINNRKSFTTILENTANDNFAIRELCMEYYLVDKAKQGDVSITLSESSSSDRNGRYTTSTYITVPGTTRTILAGRGGAFLYRSPFHLSELKGRGSVNDTAGVALGGFQSASSLVKTVTCFAGVSYNIVRNTTISVAGYRKTRSNAKWLSMYADVMFAPSASFENFTAENTDFAASYFEISDGDNGVVKKRIGWRTGLVADFNTAKTITYSGRVELGSRPGIKSNGFYLYCGLGMTISVIKPKG